MIVMYEDLKEVKQSLCTYGQDTSEPISWKLLKLEANSTGFWKQNQVSIQEQIESGYIKTELQCNIQNVLWRKMVLVGDGHVCPERVGPFLEEAYSMIPSRCIVFRIWLLV